MEKEATYIHKTETHNLNAPIEVVPLLIEMFNPKSVLDVGCGIGTWLKVFSDCGVKDILGLDGNYVDRKILSEYIKEDHFQPTDLTNPFDLGRQFDLVISLEVAEHLPAASANDFVASLVKHSSQIIFSAALPGQGGQNHLNEQWKQYWIEKFYCHNYQPFDLLRQRIWDNEKVDWWYKQNMIVFSNTNLSALEYKNPGILEAIHPKLINQHLEYMIY